MGDRGRLVWAAWSPSSTAGAERGAALRPRRGGGEGGGGGGGGEDVRPSENVRGEFQMIDWLILSLGLRFDSYLLRLPLPLPGEPWNFRVDPEVD